MLKNYCCLKYIERLVNTVLSCLIINKTDEFLHTGCKLIKCNAKKYIATIILIQYKIALFQLAFRRIKVDIMKMSARKLIGLLLTPCELISMHNSPKK